METRVLERTHLPSEIPRDNKHSIARMTTWGDVRRQGGMGKIGARTFTAISWALTGQTDLELASLNNFSGLWDKMAALSCKVPGAEVRIGGYCPGV